ncbi:putative carbon monoxide dehydrogenase [Solidesulfovibrio fructosivorans JJ]]|uniref:Putative carbon monoxide dehydrogenase n=2 Tax=Solidesulfovibrio fructosivorans TaxID=878 RepID=E1K031_SOLFR|nr:putative carbon monoxide dehydrogenase [Solidesulfovibrio fructosivorans JJ]]
MDMEQRSVFPGETVITAGGGMPDKLGKALSIGMVRGLVGFVDGDAPEGGAGGVLAGLARELIRQDILVLAAGDAACAMGQAGLLAPSGVAEAGSGLADFCDHLGISPVLRMDEGPDGASVLDFFTALAAALDVEIADLPAAASLAAGVGGQAMAGGLAAALSRAGVSAVSGAASLVGPDPAKAAEAISEHIKAKRLALGLNDRFDGSVYS